MRRIDFLKHFDTCRNLENVMKFASARSEMLWKRSNSFPQVFICHLCHYFTFVAEFFVFFGIKLIFARLILFFHLLFFHFCTANCSIRTLNSKMIDKKHPLFFLKHFRTCRCKFHDMFVKSAVEEMF